MENVSAYLSVYPNKLFLYLNVSTEGKLRKKGFIFNLKCEELLINLIFAKSSMIIKLLSK